eukprot:gnl/Chilomastix_caulleri/333.p1 GENE.gnl/Chilomastix_caulleri/333~~gnl/Chilomastix_caulleri/333.p1  ORF type:complete len:154 (-),score=31.48 gnl/Chilomastix_caulleri/333:171-632(-)
MADETKPTTQPAAPEANKPTKTTTKTTTKTKKTAKKATKEPAVKDGSKVGQKKRHADTYNTYIYRALKNIHELGISGKAMMIMNSLVNDMFDQIAREAANLARINKRNTLAPTDLEAAVKLIFPGELADHAIIEATKAIQKYSISQTNPDDMS